MKMSMAWRAGTLPVMVLCFVGGAFVLFGMAPAAVAMCVVCCIAYGRVLVPCLCAIGGVVSGALYGSSEIYSGRYIYGSVPYDGTAVCVKYICLLVAVMCIMKLLMVKSGARTGVRKEEAQIVRGILPAAAAGVVAANVLTYRDAFVMGVLYGSFEAVSVCCLVSILHPAVVRLCCRRRDGSDTNQLIISLLLTSGMLLWILPGDVYMGASPVVMAALAMLIYAVHRTGATYGFGMAVMVGALLTVREGRKEWFAWVLLIAVVMLIGRTLAGRKKAVTLVFYVMGTGLAAAAGGMKIPDSTAGAVMYLLNLCVPAVAFACVPVGVLSAVGDVPEGACMQAAATELNRLATTKMEDMANTFRRLDYTFSGMDEPAISLSQVGELVDGFRQQMARIGDAREVTDDGLIGRLEALGMTDISVTECSEKDGRSRFYVAGRTVGEGMVLSRQVAEVLGKHFGKNIRAGMNSPSLFFDEYRTAMYEEGALYRGRYHVRRIKKQGSPVSGDNFSVKEYDDGRLVMMLSDGMGSGSLASCESCLMLDTMEELLEAGFEPEYSVSFANNCLSRRNMGRTFTTFDMVIIDMYDGAMTSYKQGASATYILRPSEEGNEIEEITSTTLPIGVMEGADCDIADDRLKDGDAVIMLSDGVADMDTDNTLVSVLKNLAIGDSRRMVDELLARILGQENVVMMDDVTVMAVVMSGNEG